MKFRKLLTVHRTSIIIGGFAAWSIAMLLVGGVAHELGFSQVQASTSQHIVRLDRHPGRS